MPCRLGNAKCNHTDHILAGARSAAQVFTMRSVPSSKHATMHTVLMIAV